MIFPTATSISKPKSCSGLGPVVIHRGDGGGFDHGGIFWTPEHLTQHEKRKGQKDKKLAFEKKL